MDVRVGSLRRLRAEELMLSNCGARENSWEFLGLQDKTSQHKRKSTLNILWKDWCWSSYTLATGWEEPTHWKRPWCWERLRAGVEGDGRGWDGWMASPTQWIWVWACSGRWWWTGKPGMLQSMESLIVGHDWTSELNWTTYLSLEDICIFRPFLKLSFQASSSSYSFSHLSIRNYIWLFRKSPFS